jgi:hypothetical protein
MPSVLFHHPRFRVEEYYLESSIGFDDETTSSCWSMEISIGGHYDYYYDDDSLIPGDSVVVVCGQPLGRTVMVLQAPTWITSEQCEMPFVMLVVTAPGRDRYRHYQIDSIWTMPNHV